VTEAVVEEEITAERDRNELRRGQLGL